MDCATVSVVFAFFFVLLLVYWLLEIHYFARFIFSFLHSRFWKKRLRILDASTFSSICLTTDIDFLLFHMNNARYLREVDFARTDFYIRTGLWQRIRQKGGNVFQGASSIRYRRFIRLFSLYHVTSQIVFWDQDSVYMEHRFITKGDNFVRAIVYGKQRVINCDIGEVMNELMNNPDNNEESTAKDSSNSGSVTARITLQKPQCPPEVKLWVESTNMSSSKLRGQFDISDAVMT